MSYILKLLNTTVSSCYFNVNAFSVYLYDSTIYLNLILLIDNFFRPELFILKKLCEGYTSYLLGYRTKTFFHVYRSWGSWVICMPLILYKNSQTAPLSGSATSSFHHSGSINLSHTEHHHIFVFTFARLRDKKYMSLWFLFACSR